MPDTDDEKKAVAQADVVIVAVGFTAATEREGHDRTFTLPAGQDALVEQVVAANPRTIVLLTGGGGMDLSRWLDKVPALLHLYYPGQEGGTAVAQILFGQHNPEGKLPVTFDRSWEDKSLVQVVLRRSQGQHHSAHHRRGRQAARTTPSSTSNTATS